MAFVHKLFLSNRANNEKGWRVKLLSVPSPLPDAQIAQPFSRWMELDLDFTSKHFSTLFLMQNSVHLEESLEYLTNPPLLPFLLFFSRFQ